LGGGRKNRRHDALDIPMHLRIGEPQKPDAQRFDKLLSLPVILLGVVSVVTAAVNLQCQFERGAVEIQHIRTDAVLPPELIARDLLSLESVPEFGFGRSGHIAELTAFLQFAVFVEYLHRTTPQPPPCIRRGSQCNLLSLCS